MHVCIGYTYVRRSPIQEGGCRTGGHRMEKKIIKTSEGMEMLLEKRKEKKEDGNGNRRKHSCLES